MKYINSKGSGSSLKMGPSFELEININGSPPSSEEISQLRERVSKGKERAERWDNIISLATLGALLLPLLVSIAIALVVDVHLLSDAHLMSFNEGFRAPVFLWIMIYVIVVIFFKIYLWEWFRPRIPLMAFFSPLDELNDVSVVSYEKLIREHPEIKAYYRKAKAMGREPIVAEYDAARRWVTTAKERKEEQDLQEQAKVARAHMDEIN